ncbi:hypothetical protein C0995_005190 [Termitomyces sp. Mi166|nr:hypothetical protein C0995_005190 [Termitomyces sp. Mi166\
MAPKISLLNVFPDACLLECELTAQKFIIAADAVFLKAQGLAMLVPLHKTVFGLLKGLLDDWHLLNLTTIEWLHKAEVHQACINLWSLNKQAPWAAEFGKTVVSWEHAISTIEQIKLMHFEKMVIELELTAPSAAPTTVMNPAPTPVSASLSIQHVPSIPYIADPSSLPMHLHSELLLQEQEEVRATTLSLMQEPPSRQSVPRNKGKGKAKAMEDDDDKEEATQKFRKELEDLVVPRICDRCIANNMADHCWYLTGERPCWRCYRKSKGCLWNGIGVRTQKKHPPLFVLIMAKHIKLVQAAKAFLEQQGKSSQFFVLEGYKGKGKAKALLGDSEQAGAKQSFKLSDLVDSDSNEEEEKDRVCVIKKIKREHVEKPTGTKKKKEIIELDEEVEIVVPKAPVAGPSRPTSKPVVLVPSMPKPVPKPIIVSAPKPAAAAALSTPVSVKPARPAIKGGFVFKDPFMVRQFKLAGTEESGVLIINQVTEVPVTQGTMLSKDSSDEDVQGDNDNSDDGDVTMDVNSAKRPEETWPVAPIKAVTEVKVPAPVLPMKLKRTPFFKLYCTDEHFPYLPLGLQAPIQFEQNQPSVEQWRNRARGHYELAHEMLEDMRRHFESIRQELQWVTQQHNAMALYLCDCDMVMNWHKTNNVELGDFSDTKDLPVAGSFLVIYPH